jgi:hypothetical protein
VFAPPRCGIPAQPGGFGDISAGGAGRTARHGLHLLRADGHQGGAAAAGRVPETGGVAAGHPHHRDLGRGLHP